VNLEASKMLIFLIHLLDGETSVFLLLSETLDEFLVFCDLSITHLNLLNVSFSNVF